MSKDLPRVFRYNSVELEDPGPEHDPVDVRNLYSATYPEIVSAAIEGPELKDGKRVYTFRKAVGTKGAPCDDRPQLKAIAAGKTTRSKADDVLGTKVVEKNSDAFRAWAVFGDNRGREPLAAPTSILQPLP